MSERTWTTVLSERIQEGIQGIWFGFVYTGVSFKRVSIAQSFVSYHLLDPAPNVLGHESPSA
jgi:hypothetical protein